MRYLVQMEEGTYGSFTELVAWQKCRAFRKAISILVRTFPAEERYRLTDQIIRSSRGPAANIAEGSGRFSEKDNVRFCRMAKSSLFESQDHLSAAFDEKFIDKATLNLHWHWLRKRSGSSMATSDISGGSSRLEQESRSHQNSMVRTSRYSLQFPTTWN